MPRNLKIGGETVFENEMRTDFSKIRMKDTNSFYKKKMLNPFFFWRENLEIISI